MAESAILDLWPRGLHGIIGRMQGCFVPFNYLSVFRAKTRQNEKVPSDGRKK